MDGNDEAFEGRQEYVPKRSYSGKPRSVSAGRARTMSASYSPRMDPNGRDSRPFSASPYASPASATQRRVLSAVSKQGGGIVQAWTSPGEVVSDNSRRVHVQGMVKNKRPETIADDLFQTKEALVRAREEQKLAIVEKRRLESEISKMRSTLVRSEELIHQRERMLGPNMSMSQLYRSPDTTHLVGNLKEQNKELRNARDAIAEELMTLQRSMKATKLAELQSEIFTCTQEMDRLQRINRVIGERLTAAEDAAHVAMKEAQSANAALEQNLSGATYLMDTPIKPLNTNSISGGSVRRTLQTMLSAHKLLMSQASLLRTVFMPGLSMNELVEKARQRPNTAGAPEVLNFLQNHISKLAEQLAEQPGTKGVGASASASKSEGRPASANSKGSSTYATHTQVAETIKKHIRKLREMGPEDLKGKPDIGIQTDALAELFKAYNVEVDRLNGRSSVSPLPEKPATPPSEAAGSAANEEAPKEEAEEAEEMVEAVAKTEGVEEKPTEEGEQEMDTAAAAAAAEVEESAVAVAEKEEETAASAAPAEAKDWPLSTEGAVDYEVEVVTGDVSGAGTDGKVFIKLVGSKGASEWVELGGEQLEDSAFAKGSVNNFRISAADVDNLSHVMVKLVAMEGESGTLHSGWNLGSVNVLHTMTGWKSIFYHNDWVSRKDPVVTLEEADTYIARTPYKVTVTTSGSKGAGFEGEVYLTFSGYWGTCDSETKLIKAPGSSSHKFEAGASDEFTVVAEDVGTLTSVKVRYVPGSGSNDVWGLSRLTVTPERWDGGDFIFDGWLTEQAPTCTLYKDREQVEYKVVAFTSKGVPGAQFDGDVYITLTGEFGSTAERLLVNDSTCEGPVGQPKTLYAPDAPQEFKLKVNDVGMLASAKVRIVATGTTDSWSLDRLEIASLKVESAPAEEFTFQQWLRAGEGGEVLIPKKLTETEYEVKLTTASASDPFDGDVFLLLTGLEGTAAEVQLTNEQSGNFAAGKVATFSIRTGDVGTITSATVRVGNADSEPWWMMQKLEVTRVKSGVSSFFRYGSWMNANSFNSVKLDVQTLLEYKLVLKTMAGGSSPFDGKVSVIVNGDYSSEPVLFSQDKGNADFTPGTENVATIKCSDLGSMLSVKVLPTDAPTNTDLHLDVVEVHNLSSGANAVYFPYGKPIPSGSQAIVDMQAMNQYSATVVLSSGSFDGALSLVLCGENGDSAEVALTLNGKPPKLSAEEGANFDISVLDVGKFDTIKLVASKGESGEASSVSIDCVKVLDKSDWATTTFHLGGSIDAPGSAVLQKLARVDYMIQVKTADVRGAGTDANVVIVLEGDKGSVEETLYPSSGSFERGSTATATVTATDVGVLKSVKLKLTPANWWSDELNSEWNVASVVVTNSESGDRTTFQANKWIGLDGVAISASSSEQVYVDYQVVMTGQFSSVSSDAEVKLVGSTDNGDEVVSNNMKLLLANATTKGQSTTYIVRGMDVGALQALEFSTKNSLGLRRIEVLNKKTQATGLFQLKDRIYVYPSECPLRMQNATAESSYTVTVATAALSGDSSFQGKVFITLHGEEGNCEEQQLSAWWAPGFEAGSNQDYYIHGYKVGPIRAITLRTEKGEAETTQWGLGYVEVYNQETGAVVAFEHQAYISADTSVQIECSKVEVEYEVTVKTQDVRGGGTDADVYVCLSGDCGTLGELQLSNGSDEVFLRGQTDKFTISGPEIGGKRKIQVRLHAPSGSSSGEVNSQWALSSIEVLNKSSGIKSLFEYKSWVGLRSYTELQETSSMQALTTYKVSITTGDLVGSDYEGDSWITVVGDESTEELKLVSAGHAHSSFRRGETEEFTVTGIDVGYIRQVALRMQPSDSDPNWFVDKLTVENTSPTNANSGEFFVSTWLDRDKSSTKVYREQPLTEYTVKVYSSIVEGAGAGFDGEVELSLTGVWGSTADKELINDTPTFAPGGCETFTIKADDVGYLKEATLRARLTGKKATWSVDKLVVTPEGSERSWTFLCKDASTGALKRQVLTAVAQGAPDEVTTLPAEVAQVMYKVSVATSALPDSGFVGNVYITMYGSDNYSEELSLSKGEATTNFAAGSSHEFEVTVPDIGNLRYVVLRAEGFSSSSSKWLPSVLKVVNNESKYTAVFKVAPSSSLSQSNAEMYLWPQYNYPWKATVVTSDLPEASFDGEVYLTMGNSFGKGEEHKLSNEVGRFYAGSTQEFTFQGYSMPEFVELRIKATGKETSWHLANVELNSAEINSTSVFKHNALITEADCPVKIQGKAVSRFDLLLQVAQGSDPFRGSAYLTLVSEKGETDEVKLPLPEGYIRSGELKLAGVRMQDIGERTSLRIRTEPVAGDNAGASWQVDSVALMLEDLMVTEMYRVEGAIPAGGSATGIRLEDVECSFVLTTADEKGNGTDATAVRLVLTGEKGISPELILHSWEDTFLERGAVNTIIQSVTDVGRLTSVEVKLGDGSSSGNLHSRWQPASLQVIRRESGESFTFNNTAQSWIGETEKGAAGLLLGGPVYAQTVYVDYKVTVHTAKDCPGFNGEVELSFMGEDGTKSQTIKLGAASKGGLFQPGSSDEFSVKTLDMGVPKIVSINANLNSADEDLADWKVSRIEVLNIGSGQHSVYTYGDGMVYSWCYWPEFTKLAADKEYIINTVTQGGTSFSGEVWVTLMGQSGRSSEVRLSSDLGTETITDYDLGPLWSVEMRVAGSDLPLEKVEVTSVSNSVLSVFNHNASVAAGSTVMLAKEWADAEYEMDIHTLDMRGAGTDARVFFTLSGDNGTLDEMELTNDDPERFSRNHMDKFTFKSKDVGGNKTMTFRLAANPKLDTPPHSGWGLHFVSLLNNTTGVKTLGNFNSWATLDAPAVVLESYSYQLLYENRLTFVTSADQAEAFRGKAFVTLNGAWGVSNEDPVVGADGDLITFTPGSKMEAVFKAEDVGPLYSVSIRIVAEESGPKTWQLESVTVANATGSVGSFKPNRGQVVDADQAVSTLYRETAETKYYVRLYAGPSDGDSAAFDGEIKVVLEGLYGFSTPTVLALDAGGSSYSPGSTASCMVSGRDLGSLLKANLYMTGSVPDAGWKLDWVVVRKLKAGVAIEETQFITEQLVSAADIANAEPLVLMKTLPDTKYTVRVTTSDLPNASFEGEVVLKIGGSDGESAIASLVNGNSSNFVKGKTAEFVISSEDVGAVSNATLQIKRSSEAQQWHLSTLEVINSKTGSSSVFKYNGLLNKHNECVQLWMTSLAQYQVTVHTDAEDDAGFDGKVYLKMCGLYGSSDEAVLSSDALTGSSGFTPGSSFTFTLKAADLGKLTAVEVRTDGDASQWGLNRVEVARTANASAVDTFFNKGRISGKKVLPVGTVCRFKASVTTCDDPGADFDGDVYIALIGEDGSSDEIKLSKDGPTTFEQGSTKPFHFKAVELGETTAIRVRSEKSGSQESWKLFGINLINLDTHKTWVVYHNNVLSAPATVELGCLAPVSYTITTVTSDIIGNGTDGRVHVSIIGERGTTAEQQLPTAEDEHEMLFERGQTDALDLLAPDVGTLKGITVRLGDPEDDRLHSAWHFSSLTISVNGQVTAFSNSKWLQGPDELSVTLLTPEAEAEAAARAAAGPEAERAPEPEPEAQADEAAAEPEVQAEEAAAEPEVQVEEAVAEPEAQADEGAAETEAQADEAAAEPEVQAEEAAAEPEVQAEEAAAEPEVQVEEAAAEPEVQADEAVADTEEQADEVDPSAELSRKSEAAPDAGTEKEDEDEAEKGAAAEEEEKLSPEEEKEDAAEAATEAAEEDPKPEAKTPSNFTCKLLTSESDGSGFDGDMYITLIGEEGDSDEVKIVKAGEESTPAQPSGSALEVTFQAVEPGTLKSVRVRLDKTGEQEAWKLEALYLFNRDTDTSSSFYHNDVISTAEPVVLNKRPMVSYHMTLIVSDVKGSMEGCKAALHVTPKEREAWFIQREWVLSSSEEDTASLFIPGSTVSFTREGIEIGDMESVRVELQHPDDDPSRESGWLFTKLVIQHGDTATVFNNEKWLSSSDTSVTLTPGTPDPETVSQVANTDAFDDLTVGQRDGMDDDF